MSCKVGNKAHKERCKDYKNRGQRLINKAKKQKDHEKRMKKFAKRKEEGKNYIYKPNPYEKDSTEYIKEQNRRREKNKLDTTSLQYFESLMRKEDNRIRKEIEETKKKEVKKNK